MLDRPTNVPDAPGSYQFKDGDGRIIYVGKAASLRSRVASYFVAPYLLHPRTAQMVQSAASVEWIQVATDVEAIMLEYNLIKQHRPRFNIRLVDDKSYPYLALTVQETWPRPVVMRGARRSGVRYFGPYAHAYAIRETLDLLLRTFPVRSCTDAKFKRHVQLGRPCLMFHIERCSGPCVGEVDEATYRSYVEGLMRFLDGDIDEVAAEIEERMAKASSALEFELAARLRDQLISLRLASERQEMVASVQDSFDVVGIAETELEAAVQILHIRRGRVVGRQGFVVEKVEPLTSCELVGRVLEQHYAETPLGVPKEVFVPELPADQRALESWLAERRQKSVQIAVAMRGRKRHLLDLAKTNAEEQLIRHRTRRATDLTSRAKALDQLQMALGLTHPPLRIECYDMSHLQGTDYVGSMVVMEDGLPKRSDYRHFKVTSVSGNDDYGAMTEVLTRRLRYLLEDHTTKEDKQPVATDGESPQDLGDRGLGASDPNASDPNASDPTDKRARPTRFAYSPQLLLVDGGKGQLGVAIRVLEDLGLTGSVDVAALAKQYEEVFVPGRAEPVRIPRDSEAIYLLQQIRDEAHRFAITYHRKLRAKRMTKGALDGIRGLGPTRKKRLINELGGVGNVKAASVEELRALRWLPDDLAETIYGHLHPEAPRREAASSRVSP